MSPVVSSLSPWLVKVFPVAVHHVCQSALAVGQPQPRYGGLVVLDPSVRGEDRKRGIEGRAGAGASPRPIGGTQETTGATDEVEVALVLSGAPVKLRMGGGSFGDAIGGAAGGARKAAPDPSAGGRGKEAAEPEVYGAVANGPSVAS